MHLGGIVARVSTIDKGIVEAYDANSCLGAVPLENRIWRQGMSCGPRMAMERDAVDAVDAADAANVGVEQNVVDSRIKLLDSTS